MKRGLTLYTVGVIVAASLLAGCACIWLVISIEGFRTESARAAHSEQSIAVADTLGGTVFYIAYGERGFLATGNPSFLDSYEAALRAYPVQAANLERLEAGEPDEKLVHAIHSHIDAFVSGWVTPLIALGGRDLPRARERLAAGTGERELDQIVALFTRYGASESRLAAGQRAATGANAHRALVVSIFAFGGAIFLALTYAWRLERRVAAPIRRLLGATRRVAGGDLGGHIDVHGVAEIGELQHGFNRMIDALEAQRDELESQHAELEGQQLELEEALARVASEKTKAESLFRFAETLAAQTELDAISREVLEDVSGAVGADVATLYAAREADDRACVLVGSLGIETAKLPIEITPGYGHAGRALETGQVVEADYGATGIRVSALGDDVAVRHELHVPLLQGEQRLGVLTLGRLRDAPFDADDLELLRRMSEESAAVLGRALTAGRAARLASLNQTLIDSALDGIRLTDLDGRVVVENERMARLIADVLGPPTTDSHWEQAATFADLTKDPAGYRRGIAEVRANPDRDTDHEFELARSGRVFRRFTTPVRDESGAQMGRVIVLRELTTDRELDRMKSEFVATVTHELRTPLTSIVGFIEVLLEEEPGELNDEQRHFLEIVKRGSDRLLHLVNDLLFVARVDAGRLLLSSESVDIDTLAREAVEAAEPAAVNQGVALELSAGGVPQLAADGERLAQLLDNLLSNAIKFTPAGGQVRLTTKQLGDSVVVTVADTGIGIPDDEKGKLFQRFFRASTAMRGAVQGTGLGLAISNAIVQAHGGSIEVADTPGGGTTFTVRLPVPAAVAQAAA